MANKKSIENNKRDMNFFSEFSGSSGQMGSFLTYIFVVLLGILIIGAGVYGIILVRTAAVSHDIDVLNAEMSSEDYQNQLAKYSEISASFNKLNQHYYEISALHSQITHFNRADTADMDTIYQSLPQDVIITSYKYEDGTITLSGAANSYYSPLDMIANFSKADLFTFVQISNIAQIDPTTAAASGKNFTFTIQGSLLSSYAVMTSRFIDDAAGTPLTAADSQTYDVGQAYSVTGIKTFVSENGDTYSLSRVVIDNTAATEEQFAAIQKADSITGTVSAAVNIQLFYTLSAKGGAQ